MQKMLWNSELIEMIIERLCELTGRQVSAQVHEMDEDYYSEQSMRKKLFSWTSVSSPHLYFSAELCNHEDLSDTYVLAALTNSFFIKSLLSTFDIFPLEDMVSRIETMTRDAGLYYFSPAEIEEQVRPLRRELFSDDSNFGCYYLLGDKLRPEPAPKNWKTYTVTDIFLSGSDIFVTCQTDTDQVTLEEAELYRTFYLFG